jgi:alkylated DNA repair dioxygenase AlkB
MQLFEYPDNEPVNLLPMDGVVTYHYPLITPSLAQLYFEQLMNTIEWRHDETVIFGKRIITKRKVAWYGELPFSYTYSQTTKHALYWTKELLALKALAEQQSGETYNSCLLNLYHSGEEGMGWHSDNEKELKREGAIASISLGATRKFVFKHVRTGDKVECLLENGSLLVMKGATQTHWVHRLPPSKKISSPRINLTFRTIIVPVK